ncbi:MAG TPA: EamA family transporter [Candidatus Krumholzibacteria bacterium]|nr:EamA family transporter [Candidatus Krumholzibacteria bacterium]
MRPESPRIPWLVVVAYAGMCLIWSSTWTVIKFGLRGAPPLTAVSVRFVIAALLLALVLLARRLRLPEVRRFWWLSLTLGITQVAIPYILVYCAEQRISSGLTAVLYSTMPLVVALLARVFLGDRLTTAKLVGIAAGIGGVVLIFSDNLHAESGIGVGAVLVSVLFASSSSVLTKRHGTTYDPQVLLLPTFLVGGLVTLALAAPLERSDPRRYDGLTWMTILYLAVVGSVLAFSLYLWVLRRVEVTVVSYQTFVIPILATLLGWLLLDETITARTGLGAALILTGIAVATVHASRGFPQRRSGAEPSARESSPPRAKSR